MDFVSAWKPISGFRFVVAALPAAVCGVTSAYGAWRGAPWLSKLTWDRQCTTRKVCAGNSARVRCLSGL
ncbi:hypothetical protein PF005_g32863 [Phytophthora fragariae]|uniref:Uncharacterized protein n=1 Tax=Phytophthora fragariae TaxID=53985 RepID=A0A6A3PDN2_9STRA|nr:hypothetical protein PF009_g31812 [Phytophthora fragariae]KAE8947944.1 hypothetical protein PF009_g2438 [Phytophthora fragariae]KAE8950492.1 hypothetical protein PF011_g33220 [Phytophthora fragariae]KAE9054269.1 hypothetical protein PF010_g32607 [Phytophthora fragariae]KAE9058254.1 hypothetical protein PF006_g32201 [Phytophthora fragariae]